MAAASRARRLGLLERRERLGLTWRGRALLAAMLIVLACLGARALPRFLAVNAPAGGTVLAVEGWAPDYVLLRAAGSLGKGYETLFVTGGPLEQGGALVGYGSYAELGAATLRANGADGERVRAVPAPDADRDRTYAAALALAAALRARGVAGGRVDVVTLGMHARRSRLLYAKALGERWTVGIIAVTDRSYDAQRWWKSSAGVRTVVGETLAYAYVRCCFRPERAPNEQASAAQ